MVHKAFLGPFGSPHLSPKVSQKIPPSNVVFRQRCGSKNQKLHGCASQGPIAKLRTSLNLWDDTRLLHPPARAQACVGGKVEHTSQTSWYTPGPSIPPHELKRALGGRWDTPGTIDRLELSFGFALQATTTRAQGGVQNPSLDMGGLGAQSARRGTGSSRPG